MIYDFLRNLLFRLDAETAHHLTMRTACMTAKLPILRGFLDMRVEDPRLVQTVGGVTFLNPVGLAAGFDKNAQFINVLPMFGFSHIEVGTVTALGQPGNPKPRLFRLPEDRAILNRMGFNNEGADAVATRLTHYFGTTCAEKRSFRLGINIGKTKVVPIDSAVDDYLQSFTRLYHFADYIVVNVSSPNTPNLRELQEKEPLTRLLRALKLKNRELADDYSCNPKPIFVKVAPDLTNEALLDIIEVVKEIDISGVIATNTTISRSGLRTDGVDQLGAGGISGKPVNERSVEVIKFLHKNAPDLTIIGVGGIFTAADALRSIRAGARLVQVWTGFIYQGPKIVRDINEGLLRACQENGWNHISQAVGLDA